MDTSQRISQLEQSLNAGNASALDEFWDQVSKEGAPLIESIPNDNEHFLVTFIWKAASPTIKNVVVFFGPAGRDNPEQNQMTQLLATNLWYRSYIVKSDTRCTYLLAVDHPLTPLMSRDHFKLLTPDPLNPHRFELCKDEEDPESNDLVMSVLTLPHAPPQPWSQPNPEAPKGRLEMHRLSSRILGNERRVWVYLSPEYSPSTNEEYPMLLLFDGFMFIHGIPVFTIIDNLLYAKKIPPQIVVLLDSLNMATRNRELTCHEPFVDFLSQELMPFLREHYRITNDPSQNTVSGASFGGLAAVFTGFRASHLFGNVVAMSASFWVNKEGLTEEMSKAETVPVRYYFEVGSLEKLLNMNMTDCAGRFYDMLISKGYRAEYSIFSGGHDFINWQGSLANGLIAIARSDN
ncbi:uncharacterized protein VTP21DRAFT_9079 [Calcarisporiella thermophila]|uniref:uncharacterized protein n=1 Tax=Calcarisporiella thermophila TaxID=911321 RepID=UPI0037427E03